MKKIAVLTVVLALAIFVMPTYAGPPEYDIPVEVVNEPTVHVGSMPDVNVAGMVSVDVKNGPDTPIPVDPGIVDVYVLNSENNAIREPFQHTTGLIDLESGQVTIPIFHVPDDGKRLVIEHISVYVDVTRYFSKITEISIRTLVNKVEAWHDLIPFVGNKTPGVSEVYYASQQVRLYADPNSLVIAHLDFNGIVEADWRVSFSGYFVPTESPSLAP